MKYFFLSQYVLLCSFCEWSKIITQTTKVSLMDLYLTPWETWTSERGLRRENTVPKILKKKERERLEVCV